ncbi:MAG: tetratricopeptide repeat protein [Gammaproteobacteria bacterium]
MSTLRTLLLAVTCAATIPVQAADSASASILGANESLAAGSRALLLGEYETGVRLTEKGLKLVSHRHERARALSNLCAGYTGLRQHDKALAACDAALKLNSQNWRIYNNRSLALLGLGRVVEARQVLAAALALKPESPGLAKTRAWFDQHAPSTLVAQAR